MKTLPGTGLDTRKMPIALFISDLSASASFPGNLAVVSSPTKCRFITFQLSGPCAERVRGRGPWFPGPLTPEPRRLLTASPTEVGMANPQIPVT